jgi:hypothetical protein
MADTKLFKVIVAFEDGVMCSCDAVEYEGAAWLVPKWLPYPNEGYAKPERMIRLDQFQYQRLDPPAAGPGPFARADFLVTDPLPKTLFVGELSSQLKERYVVLDKPDAKF